MKQHIAIDLGSRKSQVCIRNSSGEIVEEKNLRTEALSRYLQKQKPSRVVMEACSESWAVGDAARSFNHELRIVPGTLVRALGVGSRGIKNDQKDAQVLSEVSTRIDLPSVHLKSQQARQIQAQLRMRHQLVNCRTKLILSIKGWLRTQAIRIVSGTPVTLEQRIGQKIDLIPSYIARQLKQIQGLNQSIQQATEELEEVGGSIAIVQRLRSIPGIGIITSLSFVATIDSIDRFTHAHKLQSYLGLTPGEKSSSLTTRKTSITKAGQSRLRSLLIESSWTLYRTRPSDPMVLWAKNIEQRRGKKIAIVALARRLAGVCYRVWRDNTVYNP